MLLISFVREDDDIERTPFLHSFIDQRKARIGGRCVGLLVTTNVTFVCVCDGCDDKVASKESTTYSPDKAKKAAINASPDVHRGFDDTLAPFIFVGAR